jgi:competence ComEA-like helix-hairpin-helix protein
MTHPVLKRSRRFGWLIATALVVLAATIATTGAAPQAQKPIDDEALEQVGYETTEKICSECHPIDDVMRTRRTARDWNNVVTDMGTKGANATGEQFALIKRYLTRYNGIVAVNSAPADDFTAVLGLTKKDADAIVEYRKANGKFADAEALAKVPGIDQTKIDAQPDALRFD